MLIGFDYIDGQLHFSNTSVERLAQSYKTPLYVYSEPIIADRYDSYQRGLQGRKAQICFAVKANSNLSVIRSLALRGAGADIVSGGELYRAMKAGVAASKIVFSGVGKTDDEINQALAADIMLFSVESVAELDRLSAIAKERKTKARISLRINPDVDAKTHPYISTGLESNKFGISYKQFNSVIDHTLHLEGIDLCGIGFHIGSQLTDLSGFEEAARRGKRLAGQLQSRIGNLQYFDAGGGLGIQYRDEKPTQPEDYVKLMLSILDFDDTTVLFEPGRSIVGPAGILITRILYSKENESKRFYICDAAMNDLIRPSLYSAYHEVYSADEKLAASISNHTGQIADLVGPVCETGDFLAKDRHLPQWVAGDLAVVATTGAYGFSMSSNYNTRPRPAEVLIRTDGRVDLVRGRESYDDLVASEVELLQ